jgi:hypothetical protein
VANLYDHASRLVCLDCEASGLENGYPIEIGWAWVEANKQSFFGGAIRSDSTIAKDYQALSQVKTDGVILTPEETRDVNAAFDAFDAAHRQTRRAFNEPDDPLEAVKTDD